MIGQDSFLGYEILPDNWVKRNDKDYEDFIRKVAPLLAEKEQRYGKDDGYHQYVTQEESQLPLIKIKYSPWGEVIDDIWTQGLPKKDRLELRKTVFDDTRIMRKGAKTMREGKDSFVVPVEYYASLMYELMKEKLT